MTETNPILALSEQFEQMTEQNAFLREELGQVKDQMNALQMEDIGWQLMTGQVENEDGLSLDTLKKVSQQLKESIAGSPLPKQANALRFSYTFGQPFIIEGLDRNDPEVTQAGTPKRVGRPTATKATENRLREFVDSDAVQSHLLGIEGQWAMSAACSTDSMYMLIGDNNSKDLKPIPLSQIVGTYEDPEFPGVVWAYLRQWNYRDGNETKTRKSWYYLDTYTGTRAKTLPGITGVEKVPVQVDKTMFVLNVNKQVGWSFGVPDLMAGIIWNRNFITMMNHGKAVSELLATYAAKVTKNSKAAATATGVKVAQHKGVASTVALSEGNSLDVFSSAGKTYDFESLRPVAGMYASSVGVSIVDLMASPSAAGSSYGSASALAPGMRRDIETRRKLVALFIERILRWAVGEKVPVTPADINEVDPYRRAQILILAINSGLVHPDESRPEILRMAGITSKHDKEPDGYLIPNNEDSLSRKDIDADGSKPTKTAPAANQGVSSGDGGAGSTAANDTRQDTLT